MALPKLQLLNISYNNLDRIHLEKGEDPEEGTKKRPGDEEAAARKKMPARD